MAAFPPLLQQYPVQGEGEDQPRPGVEYIADQAAFRKMLATAPDTGAVADWGDLPAAHL